MYPESVITKSRKGEIQVRTLISKGRYVKYNYKNPKTGKILENGKFSIILNGKEHYYMIPMKGGRFLAIPVKNGKRKIWDGKKAINV